MSDFLDASPLNPRMSDLADGEQRTVRALRLWLAGGSHRRAAGDGLARHPETAAGRMAVGAIEAAVRILAAHALRNLRYHHPCCPCLGGDEAALLALFSAAQNGDDELARFVAGTLVHPAGRPALLRAARALGDALLHCGASLPLRYALPHAIDGGETTTEAPCATLH